MRVPGQRKAAAVTRALRHRLTRPPLILVYHRICRLRSDPWGISVSPEHFSEHLAVLRRQRRLISLTELLRRLDEGSAAQGAVIITFDDGYDDNLHTAKPLLERFDAPATLFVASGAVGADREFWWDDLERLLLEPPSLPSPLELEIEGRVHRWDLGADASLDERRRQAHAGWRAGRGEPTRRHAVYHAVYWALRQLPEPAWQPVVEQLRALSGTEPSARPSHRTLSTEELRRIARDGLIEIGSHTVTHPFLAALPSPLQKHELEASKRSLEEILGQRVQSFAYPHGGPDSFTPETVRLAREAGYSSASGAFGGTVSRWVDRYRLPRVGVGDWSGEELEHRLRNGLEF